VFLRESLMAVAQAIAIARNASRLVRQNLALAVGYNAIAVSAAVLGHITPLVAAIAMSLSSLVVVVNASRLRGVSNEQPSVSRPEDASADALTTPQLAPGWQPRAFHVAFGCRPDYQRPGVTGSGRSDFPVHRI
jgi:P-type Cu2+ transporter